MDIDNLQLEAAQKLKKFSLELKERYVNVATSAYSFVATWGKNLGFEYLKFKFLKLLLASLTSITNCVPVTLVILK